MLSESPDEYVESVLGSARFPDVAAAERSVYGFSHVDVSLQIVQKWGMDEEFLEAIRHHHDQIASPRKTVGLRSVLQAASLGTTVLLTKRTASRSLNCSVQRWMGFLRDHFKLTKTQAEDVLSEVNERVTDYSILFDFNIGEGVEVDDVVEKAKDLLQEIALESELRRVEERQKKTIQMF